MGTRLGLGKKSRFGRKCKGKVLNQGIPKNLSICLLMFSVEELVGLWGNSCIEQSNSRTVLEELNK